MAARQLTGNIVTPEKAFFGVLRFADGIVSAIDETGACRPGADWVLPGFIDVHVHGLAEFPADSAEGAAGMAGFAPSTGVTGICPTLAADDFDKMCRFAAAIATLTRNRPSGSARILGSHLEGPYIELEHKGGMNAALLRRPDTGEAKQLLDAAAGTLRLMTISPELPGAPEVIRMLAEAGVTLSAGHTGCTGKQLEQAVDAGLTQVCHLFDTFDGRNTHYGVSVPALADLVLIDDRLQVELITDGIHVAPPLIELAHRAAGARRLIAITDAMQGAGLPDAVYQMADGRAFVLKAGDVGRLADQPDMIVGSCLTMNRVFFNLTSRFGFTPVEASWLTAANPARSMGLAEKTGALRRGLAADIAVLANDGCRVRQTWIDGDMVYES